MKLPISFSKNKKRPLAALFAAFALSLTLLPAAGCSANKTPQRYSYTCWDVFDTVTSVVGYADSQAEWDSQMQALHADLAAYHQLFDIYNTYDGVTNLATLNAAAGTGAVQVDERIYDLLQLGKTMGKATDGKMNIAAGAVLSLWHDSRTAGLADPANAALPNAAALAAAAEHCDLDDLVLTSENGDFTAELRDAAMSLDVGSVGKGYAAEMCARAAQARGLTSASISVGGNIRVIGQKPDGSAWTAGIEDPFNAGEQGILAALNMQSGQSLVTSGDYQRYYTVDGVDYAHLIDLETGYPATLFRSVSVLADDSAAGNAGRADSLSTALFCMPLAEGQALVEGLPGVEVCWVLPDRSVVYSTGFQSSLRG